MKLVWLEFVAMLVASEVALALIKANSPSALSVIPSPPDF
jgi:hypothetical protein